jgi:hypothetical protein
MRASEAGNYNRMIFTPLAHQPRPAHAPTAGEGRVLSVARIVPSGDQRVTEFVIPAKDMVGIGAVFQSSPNIET